MNLSELQQRYRERLFARIEALARAIRERDAVDDVMRQFHSIAGIAGTIGYDQATTIALEAERQCAHDPVDFELLGEFVPMLAAAIRA